jgi:hypothetical protein
MAVEARYFLGGQGFSARFADFVPRKMKYVAIIAACPSMDRQPEPKTSEAADCKNRAQARQSTVLSGLERKAPAPYHDKLSRSK